MTPEMIQQAASDVPVGLGQVQHHEFHVAQKISDLRGFLVLLGSHKHDLHIGNALNGLDGSGFPPAVVLLFVGSVGIFVIFVQVLFFRFAAQCAKE